MPSRADLELPTKAGRFRLIAAYSDAAAHQAILLRSLKGLQVGRSPEENRFEHAPDDWVQAGVLTDGLAEAVCADRPCPDGTCLACLQDAVPMTVLHPVAESNEWRSVARRDEEFPECSWVRGVDRQHPDASAAWLLS